MELWRRQFFMARKRDRAIAAFFAAIFIISSSALTIAVIVSLIDENKKNNQQSSATQEINMDAGQKLEGKPLAGYTPEPQIAELRSEDTAPGTGAEVKAGDTVTVDYTGAVAATGVVFQSSKDSGQPVSFPLDGVIKGWTQGVPGMKTGGTRRLHIPADLAYGANPPQGSNIPANADLVFDITLHKIGQ
jgi:FKBP-type peptidyl-prolyl cis-trans isomerase